MKAWLVAITVFMLWASAAGQGWYVVPEIGEKRMLRYDEYMRRKWAVQKITKQTGYQMSVGYSSTTCSATGCEDEVQRLVVGEGFFGTIVDIFQWYWGGNTSDSIQYVMRKLNPGPRAYINLGMATQFKPVLKPDGNASAPFGGGTVSSKPVLMESCSCGQIQKYPANNFTTSDGYQDPEPYRNVWPNDQIGNVNEANYYNLVFTGQAEKGAGNNMYQKWYHTEGVRAMRTPTGMVWQLRTPPAELNNGTARVIFEFGNNEAVNGVRMQMYANGDWQSADVLNNRAAFGGVAGGPQRVRVIGRWTRTAGATGTEVAYTNVSGEILVNVNPGAQQLIGVGLTNNGKLVKGYDDPGEGSGGGGGDGTGNFSWDPFGDLMRDLFVPSQDKVQEVQMELGNLWSWGPFNLFSSINEYTWMPETEQRINLVRLPGMQKDGKLSYEAIAPDMDPALLFRENPIWQNIRRAMGFSVWIAFAYALYRFMMPRMTL